MRTSGRSPERSHRVALAAPPVDGAANEELIRILWVIWVIWVVWVLSAALGLPRRNITLVRVNRRG